MELLIEAYRSSPLPFWLLGSVAAYALATNLLWLWRNGPSWRSPHARFALEALRLAYFMGLPYLALGGWPRRPLQGLLSLTDLGIVSLSPAWPATRWLGAIGLGLALGTVALLILVLAWSHARRGKPEQRLQLPARPWWALLIEGLYQQVHWAFYRSVLALLLGDLYIGAFWGLVLVYVEWASNPFWRRSWRSGTGAAEQWLHAALALVSALVFLLTRNLVVCLGVHWLISLSLWHTGRARPATAPIEAD